MEDLFVTYQPSFDLKKLGFNEPCFGYYVDGELRGVNLGVEELGGIKPYYQRFGFHTITNSDIDNPNKIVVTSPTFSQCFRWFRENHNLHSTIALISNSDTERRYMVMIDYIYPHKAIMEFEEYETYEEAELECLKKLIEIVKEKNG